MIASHMGRNGVRAATALHAMVLRDAVKRFDELQTRCVMDATEASLEIARLREKIVDLEKK